jgi:hypothetical protein
MSSARPGVIAFAVVAAAAVAGLAVVAITDDRELAFTLGVRPTQVAAVIEPGKRACQRPIDVSADARSVRFQVGTFREAGPELAVDAGAGTRRAAGVVPGGYGDVTWQQVRLDRELRDGERIELCVTNRGNRRVALYGGPALAARTSSAYVDRRRIPTDIALIFERDHARSALALVPTAFERAALFKPPWMGTWIVWALAIAVLIAVPLLVAGALKAATTAAPGTRPPD